jgi:hypothetical protein
MNQTAMHKPFPKAGTRTRVHPLGGFCSGSCDIGFLLDRVTSKREYYSDFRAIKKQKCSTGSGRATDCDDVTEGALSHLKQSAKVTEVEQAQVPGLAPHLEPNTHLLIQASYATKKSYRIRELFKFYLEMCDKPREEVRILCFSVRRIHAHDQLAQLGREFGFKSYLGEVEQDASVNLGEINKLIISLESLHKLWKYPGLKPYDVLIGLSWMSFPKRTGKMQRQVREFSKCCFERPHSAYLQMQTWRTTVVLVRWSGPLHQKKGLTFSM